MGKQQPIFGDILRAARKAQGMTQSQLEEKSGITVRNIAYLECGDSNPNLSTMVLLADSLGLRLRIEFEREVIPIAEDRVYDFQTFLREAK
jgi:transcriptional regulator with XRE-family HTH domain